MLSLEKARRKTLLTALGLLLFTPFWSYFLTKVLIYLKPLAALWPLLSALPLAYGSLLLWLFKTNLKKTLVTPLAEALGYSYTPHLGFRQEDAYASGLLVPADHYEGEDLLEGKVGRFPFSSSDLALYRKIRVRGGAFYQKLFGGTLYRFALPFSVPGEVRLFPQEAGMRGGENAPRRVLFFTLPFLLLGLGLLFFGGHGEAKAAGGVFILVSSLFLLGAFSWKRGNAGLRRVVLESEAFEALFEVLGEDQVGARRVLTPGVQEALVEMRRALKKPFWLSLRGKEAWLLVSGNRFEPSLFRPLNQKTLLNYIHRWNQELEEAAHFLEALGLELEARKRGLLPPT